MTSGLPKTGSMPQRKGQTKQQLLYFDGQQIRFPKQCWRDLLTVAAGRAYNLSLNLKPQPRIGRNTEIHLAFPREKGLGFGRHQHAK